MTFAWEQHPEAGNLTYTAYTPDSYRGDSISRQVLEDHWGNLYVANEAGLLKFNGESWSQMPVTGQASYTTSIAINNKEHIWISGLKSVGYYSINARGSYVFNDMTHSVQMLPESSEFGTFWKLYADQQHIYLIATKHVLRWDGNNWKVWPFEEQRRILPSWIDDTLYIYARGTGLFYLNGDAFELITTETIQTKSGITSVIGMTPKGLLCATLDNGFVYIKNGTIEPFSINFNTPTIIVAQQLKNGNIAIGTMQGGILIMDRDGHFLRQINHNKSSIYDLIGSRDGTIWGATADAILKIPELALTHYSDNAQDIVRHQQRLYYTNRDELMALHSDESGGPPTTQALKGRTEIWDLQPVGTDLLYGSTKGLGVLQHNGDEVSKPFPRYLLQFYPSWNDPTLIYSNDPPMISRWQRTTTGWTYIDSLPDFTTGALSLVELPNSDLLISSENSPLFLANWTSTETIRPLGQSQGLPSQFIWAHCLRINECVIVISDKGLFRYDNETQKFSYNTVLGDDLGTNLFGLASCPAADNNGWILRLPSAGQNQNQVGHLLITDDNQLKWVPWQLPSLNLAGKVEALLHEKEGDTEILWVGGSKDLLRYDLSNMPDHPVPNTRLTAIRELDAKQTYYNGAGRAPVHLEWQYPQSTLRIEYAAPPSPIIVRGYQTRLAGFNNSWSEPSKSTFRDFTNLSHGDYTLEVRAIDEFGRTGESASLSFTILPPWYSTTYAFVGYIAASICALFIASHWRDRKLLIENERLESQINARTIEINQQKLKLIQANKTKQNFLASMSHEIRNPLNGILGITRILKEKEAEQGISSEEINHLHSCSKHLNQLLGQTLDYSSLEAGKLRTRVESFDPSSVLDEVIQIQHDMAQTKGIQLILEKPAITYRWKGDPVFLRQILINLVSNGIKYTPAGSVRLILTYQEAEDSIMACFEVIDTGPGIPKDKQQFIFEEFTRLPESEASQIPGTGLGLAISSQMAQLMGGRLELDGDNPNGARFLLHIEFGIDLYSPSKTQSTAPNNTQMLAGKRILIADDMDFNRYVSAEVLRSLGAKIDLAENGLVALEKLRSATYDIAILDINMPKMSGLEAVNAFLKDHNEPSPDFIALSAYDSPEMEEKCIAAGFNHFIEKPLDPEKLKKLLKRHQTEPDSQPEQSLLSYLAENTSKSLEELYAEYRKSFKQELANLQLTLINNDTKQQREVIHKLLGLCSISKTPKISELIKALSARSKEKAPKEEIASLIEQLDKEVSR